MNDDKDIRAILRTPIVMYHKDGLISTRAFTICEAARIFTLGELIRFHHDRGLLSLPKCGPMSVFELEGIMSQVDTEKAIRFLNKHDRYSDLPERIRTIIVDNFRRPLLGFTMGCIKQFYATFDHACAFYSFFFLDQKNLAERFNGLDGWELKHYCYQLLSEIHSSFMKEQLDDTYIYELLVVARAVLWFCDDQFAEELEASDVNLKVKRGILLADFGESIEKLTKRAKLLQQKVIPTYLKTITMFHLSEEEVDDLVHIAWDMRTGYGEVFHFLAERSGVLFRYESLDMMEISKNVVVTKYPYLTEEQVGFVAEFYSQYRYFPMFFLLKAYLEKSEKKQDVLFAMATGICGGCRRDLAEIGKELDLSKEQVKQLMAIAPKDLFKDKEWMYYQFGSTFVIAEDDELYKNVVEHEKVDIPFDLFAQVCVMGFPLKTIKENNMRFLVNNRFSSQTINKVCQEVKMQNKRIKSGIETLQIDDLLTDIPDDKKDYYKCALSIIIRKAYGLLVNVDGDIVLPPNGVDVVYELSEILREKGRPMSLKELFTSLRQRCPDVRYKKPEQIKPIVLKSKDLKSIGKSGRYALAEWCGVYKGSIRDLVADILKRARTPLHIDHIMKKVLKVYPFTNKNSVTSSINSDKDRFVLYGEGYYGLLNRKYGDGFVPPKARGK